MNYYDIIATITKMTGKCYTELNDADWSAIEFIKNCIQENPTLNRIIARQEKEITELRARLEKAVEFPRIVQECYVEYIGYGGKVVYQKCRTPEAAEARLKELQGGER